MAEPTTTRPRVTPITWIGLFIALFGMLIVRQVVNQIGPTKLHQRGRQRSRNVAGCVCLLLVVKLGEGLPLTSVGLGTARWLKSIVWGLLLTVACSVVAVLLIKLTGYSGGGGKMMDKLPLWLITLIVTRAGVVEELCYRGYAIERLQLLGLPRWLAAAVPLIIFGVGHWTGGWANIVIALALGGILAVFYLWRRDLVANMIGHFLVDFVGNFCRDSCTDLFSCLRPIAETQTTGGNDACCSPIIFALRGVRSSSPAPAFPPAAASRIFADRKASGREGSRFTSRIS